MDVVPVSLIPSATASSPTPPACWPILSGREPGSQITAGSLLGDFGYGPRDACEEFFGRGLVHLDRLRRALAGTATAAARSRPASSRDGMGQGRGDRALRVEPPRHCSDRTRSPGPREPVAEAGRGNLSVRMEDTRSSGPKEAGRPRDAGACSRWSVSCSPESPSVSGNGIGRTAPWPATSSVDARPDRVRLSRSRTDLPGACGRPGRRIRDRPRPAATRKRGGPKRAGGSAREAMDPSEIRDARSLLLDAVRVRPGWPGHAYLLGLLSAGSGPRSEVESESRGANPSRCRAGRPPGRTRSGPRWAARRSRSGRGWTRRNAPGPVAVLRARALERGLRRLSLPGTDRADGLPTAARRLLPDSAGPIRAAIAALAQADRVPHAGTPSRPARPRGAPRARRRPEKNRRAKPARRRRRDRRGPAAPGPRATPFRSSTTRRAGPRSHACWSSGPTTDSAPGCGIPAGRWSASFSMGARRRFGARS